MSDGPNKSRPSDPEYDAGVLRFIVAVHRRMLETMPTPHDRKAAH